MPANSNTMCPFKVDLAVAGPLRFAKAQRRRNGIDGFDIGSTSFMSGSFDDHLEHAGALRSGQMGRNPPIWMTVLSYADPSITPKGEDVGYVCTSTPSAPAGGWEALRNGIAGNVIAHASQYLDGLQAEIGRCITTPNGTVAGNDNSRPAKPCDTVGDLPQASAGLRVESN